MRLEKPNRQVEITNSQWVLRSEKCRVFVLLATIMLVEGVAYAK